MEQTQFDVAVLGAGIIGVSVALHLQQRGRSVLLLDRQAPGQGTSYGNAGLIERSGVVPYGFPRDWKTLADYALQRNPGARADWRALPRLAPWLWRFWRESAPGPLAGAARDMLPLIERSVHEHECLMAAAGMLGELRKTGWIEAYRDPAAYAAALQHAANLQAQGLRHEALAGPALRARMPGLHGTLAGAVHWLDPATVGNPGAVVAGYAALFVRRGGVLAQGDASTLLEERQGWRVETATGPVRASEVVAALGPWSDAVFGRLGYRFPLAVKRGYHVHFRAAGTAPLTHPVVDAQLGYVLAPMDQGIRLTSGVEFARRDSRPTPLQLAHAERRARELFALGERIEAEPWMGCRPCMPDMRPVIGAAARHRGLWFCFGHNHHGLTLGPVSGRLLAEMMTGQAPFTDPAPYAPARFGGQGYRGAAGAGAVVA